MEHFVETPSPPRHRRAQEVWYLCGHEVVPSFLLLFSKNELTHRVDVLAEVYSEHFGKDKPQRKDIRFRSVTAQNAVLWHSFWRGEHLAG
jgi:hypothetical protein